MYGEEYIVMMNTNMTNKSTLGDTLKSYELYSQMSYREWESTITYSTVDGFDNNMEALIHYGLITLGRLEHYEEYEKCKKLNYILKLYEPVSRK
tara:strand:- start:227 stop:508 length:282 start_codon:yes stop_codon:yes gene_type:complete